MDGYCCARLSVSKRIFISGGIFESPMVFTLRRPFFVKRRIAENDIVADRGLL